MVESGLFLWILLDVYELRSGAVAFWPHEVYFALCFLHLAHQAHLFLLLRVKLLDFLQLGVDACLYHLDETRHRDRELRVDADYLCFFLSVFGEGEDEAVAQVVDEIVGVFEL